MIQYISIFIIFRLLCGGNSVCQFFYSISIRSGNIEERAKNPNCWNRFADVSWTSFIKSRSRFFFFWIFRHNSVGSNKRSNNNNWHKKVPIVENLCEIYLIFFASVLFINNSNVVEKKIRPDLFGRIVYFVSGYEMTKYVSQHRLWRRAWLFFSCGTRQFIVIYLM